MSHLNRWHQEHGAKAMLKRYTTKPGKEEVGGKKEKWDRRERGKWVICELCYKLFKKKISLNIFLISFVMYLTMYYYVQPAYL